MSSNANDSFISSIKGVSATLPVFLIFFAHQNAWFLLAIGWGALCYVFFWKRNHVDGCRLFWGYRAYGVICMLNPIFFSLVRLTIDSYDWEVGKSFILFHAVTFLVFVLLQKMLGPKND